MIIKEESLDNNIYSNILNNLPILEEVVSPATVPILECYSYNEYMIKFNDLYDYAYKSGKTFNEAFYDIKNINNLDYLYISIDEALIYDNPHLLYEFNNLLILPQSQSSEIYQLCELCMNDYLSSGNEDYINFFLEADDATLKQYEQKLMKQKMAFENTRKQLSTMKQGDKQYQVANARLMGMQTAIDNTTKMIDELKKRGSVSTINNGSKEERLLAYKKAKQDAAETAKNIVTNPGTIPTKVKPIKPKPSTSTGSAPPPTTNPTGTKPAETNPVQNPSNPVNTTDKPSWFSQKWSAFKNWANNLNSTEDKQSTWFTDLLGNIKGFFGGNNNQQQQQQKTATAESYAFNEIGRGIKGRPIKPGQVNGISQFPSNPANRPGYNPPAPTTRGIGPGSIPNHKLTGSQMQLNNPGTVNPATQPQPVKTTRFNSPNQQPVNAATDLDLFVNEVYRPRRTYRHRYMR